MSDSQSKDKSNETITNIDRKLNVLVTAFAVIVMILLFTSLQNGRVTCRNFVANIYLYVVLAILLVGIFTLFREKYITPPEERGKLYDLENLPGKYFQGLWVMLVALIAFLVYLFAGGYQMKNHLLNHAMWLLLIFGISMGFYPLFKTGKAYNYITIAATYVVIIFMVMSGIVYANYDWVLKMGDRANWIYSWLGITLLLALLTIIISSIFLMIFSSMGLVNMAQFTGIYRAILYFAIFIFSAYISYDTIYVIKRTRTCNVNNKINYPNYPIESFMIFIDLWNIFVDLLNLQTFQQ